MGLRPALSEFRYIIKRTETQFKDGIRGHDWVVSFTRRHNMTLKTGGMMQLARKSVTSYPFAIYGFYDLLKNLMKLHKITDRPECTGNLDETCFPLDPSRVDFRVAWHMPIEQELEFTDYADNRLRISITV